MTLKSFLRGQAYYLKKDTMVQGICFFFLIASLVLPIWIGAKSGFHVSNFIEPLRVVTPLSLFLYFVIPVQACFFATEGFEHGTVKPIIASGQTRESYYMGKFVSEIKVILWCLFQFFGLYYVIYMAAVVITGSRIGTTHLVKDLGIVLTVLGFNILYLSAYAAMVMMVGIIVEKTAPAVVLTFVIIFGDFVLGGYLKDSSSVVLRTISDHSLMTQIMKFSRIYVVDSQQVLLAGANDYFRTAIIPLVIIVVCLSVALISFGKKDIHA